MIINNIKQGNNIYFLNKNFTTLEAEESGDRFASCESWFGENRVFKNYYCSPSYMVNITQKGQLSNSELSSANAIFVDFTQLGPNAIQNNSTNLSDDITSLSLNDPKACINCIDYNSGDGFLFFLVRSTWSVIDNQQYTSLKQTIPSSTTHLMNLYRLQFYNDIIFTDASIKFGFYPIFYSRYTLENITTSEQEQQFFYAFPSRRDTPDSAGNYYQIESSDWQMNVPISTFTNCSNSTFNFDATDFQDGVTVNTQDFQASNSYTIKQCLLANNLVIGIKIPNFTTKTGNYTPYEYLCKSISTATPNTRLTLLGNATSQYNYNLNEVNNYVSQWLAVPQSNILYKASSDGAFLILEGSKVINIKNSNERLYFTQSEIDSIFNPTS